VDLTVLLGQDSQDLTYLLRPVSGLPEAAAMTVCSQDEVALSLVCTVTRASVEVING
jgi:hypothetical protein